MKNITPNTQTHIQSEYHPALSDQEIENRINSHIIAYITDGLSSNDPNKLNLSNHLIEGTDFTQLTRNANAFILEYIALSERAKEVLKDGYLGLELIKANNATFINTSFQGLHLTKMEACNARFEHCDFRDTYQLALIDFAGSEMISPKFTLDAHLAHMDFAQLKSISAPQFYDGQNQPLHGFSICPDTHNIIYDGKLSSAFQNQKNNADAKHAYKSYVSNRQFFTETPLQETFSAKDLHTRLAAKILHSAHSLTLNN